MKVTVSQQNLAHAVNTVSRAVSPRTTLPVLGNVLVATDEGRLRLSATNLELGISCWIGAQIEEDGAITVPARTFADLVSTLPSDSVKLTVDQRTQSLNVVCSASNTDIRGIDAQEYPPMAVLSPDSGIELNYADFKEMIQQVAFSASVDDARPVLQGVLLTINDQEISLAATDGYRISVRHAGIPSPVEKEISAIIPARALNELARLASDGEKTVRLVLPSGRGQAIFSLQDAELSTLLIDGTFPDYKVIIPRNFKTTSIISTGSFLKACKQAEIIAREGNNVIRLNIQPGQQDAPGQVEITAQNEETGSSEIQVDANIEGPALVIAFNVKFLREVLDVIKTPSIALETNANNTPGCIRPVGDEDYQHVIMPMHLG
ncbi:MAG: DNA polymerase III subunit beta [Anaerolineae bacterium]|jgi:DNA polymerase-3 subunit beta|nr:DNA polymerase III subunit beta [Anaerolineae bacterium]